jgi:hypothetical protein
LITTWIPRVLGFVLLPAAGLKAYGFNVDQVARTGGRDGNGFFGEVFSAEKSNALLGVPGVNDTVCNHAALR